MNKSLRTDILKSAYITKVRKLLLDMDLREDWVVELLYENIADLERCFSSRWSARGCAKGIWRNFTYSSSIGCDLFYEGLNAHGAGLTRESCPATLKKEHQFFWLSGFKSSERRSLNPFLSTEEYVRISNEADQAYFVSMKSGILTVNPYQENTEAHEIWGTRMLDLPSIYGKIKQNIASNDAQQN